MADPTDSQIKDELKAITKKIDKIVGSIKEQESIHQPEAEPEEKPEEVQPTEKVEKQEEHPEPPQEDASEK